VKCYKDCKITSFENFVASDQTVKHGSTVTFTCLQGFVTTDNLEFTCEDGVINTNSAQCLSKINKISLLKSYDESRSHCQSNFPGGDLWGLDPRWLTMDGRREILGDLNNFKDIFTIDHIWIAMDKKQDATNYRYARSGDLVSGTPSNPFNGQWYPSYPVTNSGYDCIGVFLRADANQYKVFNWPCSHDWFFGCESA